jgi:hypothetical protein
MVRKAFEILLAHPEGLPAKQVLAGVADQLTLSPFEASDYPKIRVFEDSRRSFASARSHP